VNPPGEESMEHRDETAEQVWERSGLRLKRHFQESTQRMREQALGSKGYDPARLFRWGQMMSMAVVRMMEAAEERFGAAGQEALCQALVELGKEIGKEVLCGFQLAPGTPRIQAVSSFVTYVNEEIWASPEVPRLVDENTCVCDVLWCPHQDHYKAFDCRVQRYIVQGLLEAFQEETGIAVDARFTQIIPKGAETCRFEIKTIACSQPRQWSRYSQELSLRALQRAGSAGDSSKAP